MWPTWVTAIFHFHWKCLGIPVIPKLQRGIDVILDACDTHGKAAACLAGSVDTGIEWVQRGFRMVSYSYDIGLMTGALKEGIEQIRSGVADNGSK